MTKPPKKDDLAEAKAIAARLLATPPKPHGDTKANKPKSVKKRATGKGRAPTSKK